MGSVDLSRSDEQRSVPPSDEWRDLPDIAHRGSVLMLCDALLKIRGETDVKTLVCERVKDIHVKHSSLSSFRAA